LSWLTVECAVSMSFLLSSPKTEAVFTKPWSSKLSRLPKQVFAAKLTLDARFWLPPTPVKLRNGITAMIQIKILELLHLYFPDLTLFLSWLISKTPIMISLRQTSSLRLVVVRKKMIRYKWNGHLIN
jgi:uncharacterized membrane protein YqaE (UPF0057 family)